MKTALLFAGAILLAGCSGSKTPTEVKAGNETAVAVRTVAVAPAEWPAVYEATGTVRARTAAIISSKVMGYVREVHAQAGDRVRQGQILVVLDARDLVAGASQASAALDEARSAVPEADNAVAAAKANLELAEITFRRMEGLFKKESISNQEFDEAAMKRKVAQAGYEMAQARRTQLSSKIAQAEQGVRSAEVMRSYAQITAPFDGIVTDAPVQQGSMAAPGAPLLTVERAGAYRLEAAVEESKLSAIRMGQPVTVSFDSLGNAIEGRVSEIVPAVDAASRAFIVKIDLPPLAQLRSGSFGRARFDLGKRQVLSVPAAAVTERGQMLSVMVADGGTARARFLTLGQKHQDRVEVLSGLNPGEKVIFPVPAGVADGSPVEERP